MKNFIISVSYASGCYRHIELSDHCTLAQLSYAINTAFDLDDDHLHAFFMDNVYWSHTEPYWRVADEPGDKLTSSKKLCNLHLSKGSCFKYLFDFGDEWRFQCKLLRIVETETPAVPHVIRSVGQPPEQYPSYDEDDEFLDGYDEDDDEEDLFDCIEDETDEDELLKQFAKIGLSAETVDDLYKTFLACANAYGIIPLNKVYEIYTSMFEPLSYDTFIAFAETIRLYEAKFSIFAPFEWNEIYSEDDMLNSKRKDEWELLAEGLDEEELYAPLKAEQADKPYKIFTVDELMKFAEDSYTLNTPAGQEMLRFAEAHIKFEDNQRSALAALFAMMLSNGNPVEAYFPTCEIFGMKITGKKNKRAIKEMYEQWSHKVSKPANRGYSDEELAAMGIADR